MKQIFLNHGSIGIKEVVPPLINEHTVLVSVYYSFISSGTEQTTVTNASQSMVGNYINNASSYSNKIIGAIKEHGLSGTLALTQEKFNKFVPLGYSCAGKIIAVGAKVTKYKIGDFVACAGATFAQHADIVSVPENLITRVKNSDNLKLASLTTIGAIALQGIRRAQLQIGETVCIIGLGLIGQITAQLAKHAGVRVIGVDIQNNRLLLAKNNGIDHIINSLETNLIQDIAFATNHNGVDTTIICASAKDSSVIQQAMEITRRKGRVVLVGDVPINFNRDPFYSKEIDFLISCSYGPGRYDHTYEQQNIDYPYPYVRWTENRNMSYFVELVESKKLALDSLISHEFDIDNASHAYQALSKNGGIGVVIRYPEHKDITVEELITLEASAHTINMPEHVRPYTYTKKGLGISIIGAGGFAKTKILPTITRFSNTHIHAIIDTDTANALTLANVYKAHHAGNDYHKVLGDDDTNLVVIATPHAFHTQQIIDCLAAGKAVFAEKPAAVSFEQLAALKQFFAHHKDILFCMDFLRSSAPFMQEIKAAVATRTNPLMITYRMNAGYLPKSYWIQSEEHRGRIVGEACHIFELFCFLTDAKPVSIGVNTPGLMSDNMLPTDNFAATVTMSDGSCCSLVYSSCGNSSIGKEYMEVFFDGKSIAMNDFYSLKGYGLPRSFNKTVHRADKGHEHLLKQFFKAAAHKEFVSPIPVDRILQATEATLIADKLARAGGGFERLG